MVYLVERGRDSNRIGRNEFDVSGVSLKEACRHWEVQRAEYYRRHASWQVKCGKNTAARRRGEFRMYDSASRRAFPRFG